MATLYSCSYCLSNWWKYYNNSEKDIMLILPVQKRSSVFIPGCPKCRTFRFWCFLYKRHNNFLHWVRKKRKCWFYYEINETWRGIKKKKSDFTFSQLSLLKINTWYQTDFIVAVLIQYIRYHSFNQGKNAKLNRKTTTKKQLVNPCGYNSTIIIAFHFFTL